MTLNRVLISVLILLTGPALFAQDSQLPPFVSRLTAITGDNGVRLSWQDSQEADGDYFIYSLHEEITESNFSEAQPLARVEAGVEGYLHKPEGEGPHYYAVLASSVTGEQYVFFVPYRNKTTRGVRFSPKEKPQKLILPISGIAAEHNDKSVTLSFGATAGEEVIIYRSTERINSAEDLVKAVLAEKQVFSGIPFFDTPMAGIPYYYGVFYDEALRTGTALFQTGANVLDTPVQIPLSTASRIAAVTPAIRVPPLPYLMLTSRVDSGEALKAAPNQTPSKTTELSKETEASVARLLESVKPPEFGGKKPVWLSQKNGGGLENLIAESFEENRWEDALSAIDTYMRTRRTIDEKQRAHFYKGQCLYFLGRYEEAFMEFIFAEQANYPQVQPWLDDIISLLASG